MITDARSLPPGTSLEADLCIIGTGPAGITLCRELARSGRRIVVLESGDLEPDPPTQALARGVVSGVPFDWYGVGELERLRVRQVGGSSNHWTGLCRPFDPIDFGPLPARGDASWPFGREELEPHYEKAQVDCQLGPYEYGADVWAAAGGFEALASPGLVTQVLQLSPPTRFGRTYRDTLADGRTIEVVIRANVTGIRTSPDGSGVASIVARTLDGNELSVTADAYVLAAGGIENARLLLVGDDRRPGGVGNGNDLVGRHFAEHPAVRAARVIGTFDPAMTPGFERLDLDLDGTTTPVRFCLSPTPEALAEWGLPNVTVMLRPVAFGEAFQFGERVGGNEIRALLARRGEPTNLFAEIVWEQQANPDSRVLLGPEVDELGLPVTVVDWQLTDADRSVPERVLSWLGHELGRLGIGRAETLMANQPANTRPVACNSHHMGTTRIDVDPTRGVVDSDLRVHGVANLWVAGSSVFPTGGWSNPTLTVVALAHRLAAHLDALL